jgi:CBS domain-containing protein
MLRGKSSVYAVGPGDTVYDALRLMSDKNIGAVLVRSSQGIDGIFSERDYARKLILVGKTSGETLVRDVMTTQVVSVEPDWTADQCMALMTEKHIRHLPVMEQGRLIAAGPHDVLVQQEPAAGAGTPLHHQERVARRERVDGSRVDRVELTVGGVRLGRPLGDAADLDRGGRLDRRLSRLEAGPALGAEPRVVGVAMPAVRAERHRASPS